MRSASFLRQSSSTAGQLQVVPGRAQAGRDLGLAQHGLDDRHAGGAGSRDPFPASACTSAAMRLGDVVVAHPLLQRGRRLLDVFGEGGQIAGGLEGHLAGQGLVGQHAEGVDVGPVIVGRAHEPLGRHVLRASRRRWSSPRRASPSSRATPKSTSLTRSARRPRGSSMTLSGFMSRWTMPFSCAACRPLAIWRRMGRARAGGSGPPLAQHPPERGPVQVLHHEEDAPIGQSARSRSRRR